MPGIAPEHRFKNGNHLFRIGTWLSVVGPKLPGILIHQALGIEGGGVQVVGRALHHVAHGFRVGAFALHDIIGLLVISFGQRGDISLLGG